MAAASGSARGRHRPRQPRRRWLGAGGAPLPLLLLLALLVVLLVVVPDVEAFLVASSMRQRRRSPRQWRGALDGEAPPEASGALEQPSSLSWRQVALVKRFARLPFWPIWHGLLIMLLDTVGLKEWSEGLEAKIGGRVSPMIFLPGGGGAAEDEEGQGGLVRMTDPFLMCVHHKHSFHALDPFRALQARFFPEGFPAHPHSGFNTLTYVLEGNMKHRDSMGVKQVYGDGAAQFLTAGSGVLHEEMWSFDAGKAFQPIELFQLWINLPRRCKGMEPSIQLAGGAEQQGQSKGPIPSVTVPGASVGSATTTVRVIMGEAEGVRSPIEPWSPMSVLHVTCEPGARWEFPLPAEHSLTLYVRRGPLNVGVGGGKAVRLATYEVAFFKRDGDRLVVQAPPATAGGHKDGADFLLMAGEPLREPILASGPFVESDAQELQRAYARYQMGAFGQPWDPTLSDDEWRRLCAAAASGGSGSGSGSGSGDD